MADVRYSATVETMIELYKRGSFDFITIGDNGIKHKKQEEALQILTDDTTREFLYGGAAGGAKSYTGCIWLMFASLAYPGVKSFIGRETLKRLRESTYITFKKVCDKFGLVMDVDWKYNGQDHFIEFSNGSRIDFLDLRFLPKDELYERYGSLEYTFGWIEEGGEINFGAFDTLKTRVGRHLNDKYGLKPKIFVTCNPKKNWMFSYFYKPLKDGLLKIYQRFLTAFVSDNPFIEKDYLEQLESTTDKAKKERLLKGNWEYDDNPYKLIAYDNILALWTNSHLVPEEKYYLVADVARFGSDHARIGVFKGWVLVEVKSFPISATTMIQACIMALMTKYQIPKKRALADDDGVGGGVVDNCGIYGFVNGAAPFDEVVSDGKKDRPKYKNLQTQCLVGLADKINANQVGITADLSEKEKEEIKEELDSIERIPDIDMMIELVPKADVKQNIGRSPDWRDLFLMRKWFDYVKESRMNVKAVLSRFR